jgi:hypothetical protein
MSFRICVFNSKILYFHNHIQCNFCFLLQLWNKIYICIVSVLLALKVDRRMQSIDELFFSFFVAKCLSVFIFISNVRHRTKNIYKFKSANNNIGHPSRKLSTMERIKKKNRIISLTVYSVGYHPLGIVVS